jgi:cyclophilin family peptidyl-prolyl cis-trans isomerase
MPNSRVFLDIDIDSRREKYARAAAFVEATDLRYGFSSKDIAELGGGEKQRVLECYQDDFDWSGKGPIEIEPAESERLVLELFDAKAPLAVENFKALCTGERGVSKNCGNVPYHYKGVRFHRVVEGFMAQGGDFAMQNGSGGESVWGKKFKDEKDGLKLKHDARGVLAMGNTGKNSNGSQFFVTFAPCKALDGKHVVFGKVVEGFDVLDKIEARAVAAGGVSEEPTVPVVVADCGVL